MLQDLTATISKTGQPKAANVASAFVRIVAREKALFLSAQNVRWASA
jgi:hypothetical protein